MKRFEIDAYIAHQGSVAGKAIATFREHTDGRFVHYKDVEAIIEKAEYWEAQFRAENKRVKELCDQRHRARTALKKLQEDLL